MTTTKIPTPCLPDSNLAIVESEARACARDKREFTIMNETIEAMAREIREWRALALPIGLRLNALRDWALRIAIEHGFTDASVAEDIALMHSELSEALEDHRAGRAPTEAWYLDKKTGATIREREAHPDFKPCGVPSEMADVIIRVLHFCGKHGIDIERAVREKMKFNESRPFKHGGKTL